MLADGGMGNDLRTAAESALAPEKAGYDAIRSSETGHDPLLPLLIAAEHTERIGAAPRSWWLYMPYRDGGAATRILAGLRELG